MAAGKKPVEFNVSELDSPVEKATVHGVVTELSPVKVSKKNQIKYFSGSFSDGKKCIDGVFLSTQQILS